MDDALGHRAEAFRILRLTADAHGEERAAMKRLRERDDFEFIRAVALERDAARQLQRGFVRFGARVGEERAVGERQIFQTPGETQHRLVGVAIADVPQLAALLVQHFQQFGMRMTERGDGDAAGEVDIVAALRIPDARAETAIRHEGRGRKHRHHDFVEGLSCHSQVVHGKSSLQVRGNIVSVGNRGRYVLRIRDAFYELPRAARDASRSIAACADLLRLVAARCGLLQPHRGLFRPLDQRARARLAGRHAGRAGLFVDPVATILARCDTKTFAVRIRKVRRR
jgi:hypothetical protein